MQTKLSKIKAYFASHKILSTIILIVILYGGYIIYQKFTSTAGDNRYITEKVTKGGIVASVSGSGQVSVLNQIDVKTKSSGEITYLGALNGSWVNKGAIIAKINTSDAEKNVRDAEINLESAKIALEKLKLQKSNENMTADLAKAYDDGFNTVSNVYLDLPKTMTGLNNMFFKPLGSSGQWGIDWYGEQTLLVDRENVTIYKNNVNTAYTNARKAYDASLEKYKSVTRTSSPTEIKAMIDDTYDTTKLISDAIKSSNNYLDFVNDSIGRSNYNTPSILNTDKASLNTYTGQVNTHLVNLLASKTNIKTYTDEFSNSSLDVQTDELGVKQKENSLQDAKDKLEDYYVRAPLSGTVANLLLKKGDTVSANATAFTLITNKQLATISLNEVDVAKIKIGEKATLTFDAVPELTISGLVSEIDSIGTVSQGVVTYNVKISFDTQDERIKPSMSVSAAIITDTKQDVLIVPNSAVKSQSGTSYVEMFDTPLAPPTDGLLGSISKITPTKIPVEIGISNNSQTEIISGIKEGDAIVSRTIAPSATKTAAAPSLFGATGAGGNRNGASVGGGARATTGTTGR